MDMFQNDVVVFVLVIWDVRVKILRFIMQVVSWS